MVLNCRGFFVFMLIVTGVHFEFMLASINKSINLHLLKILYLFRSWTAPPNPPPPLLGIRLQSPTCIYTTHPFLVVCMVPSSSPCYQIVRLSQMYQDLGPILNETFPKHQLQA